MYVCAHLESSVTFDLGLLKVSFKTKIWRRPKRECENLKLIKKKKVSNKWFSKDKPWKLSYKLFWSDILFSFVFQKKLLERCRVCLLLSCSIFMLIQNKKHERNLIRCLLLFLFLENVVFISKNFTKIIKRMLFCIFISTQRQFSN